MKQKIYIGLQQILDDWDPIGILQYSQPINDSDNSIGEYNNYIEPIVNTYLANESIYDYLIELYSNLIDDPDDYVKEEIKLVTKRIVEFLSQHNMKNR